MAKKAAPKKQSKRKGATTEVSVDTSDRRKQQKNNKEAAKGKKRNERSNSTMLAASVSRDYDEEVSKSGKKLRQARKVCSTRTNNSVNFNKPAAPGVGNRQQEQKHVEEFVASTIKKGILGLRTEFARHPRTYDMTKCVVFSRHQQQNRYKDVGCLDSSRVILKWADNKDPDGYIHANYVDTLSRPKRFICAQAPLDGTCEDFWQMVVQEGVEAIIMLCNFLEKGAKKCSEYFPHDIGQTKTFGSYTVKKTHEEFFKFRTNSPVKIKCSTLQASNGMIAQNTIHYQWVDWPDRGVPSADEAPIELLERVNVTTRPMIVHCSAGIGRTGSIVLLQTILELLKEGRPFDNVEQLMLKMREQRAASVQTDHQYLYVHEVLLQYFRNKDYLDNSVAPFLEKFAADYTKAVGVPC